MLYVPHFVFNGRTRQSKRKKKNYDPTIYDEAQLHPCMFHLMPLCCMAGRFGFSGFSLGKRKESGGSPPGYTTAGSHPSVPSSKRSVYKSEDE